MSRAEFRERIRRSLSNPILQIALDANADRRATGRVAAFGSLPDWPERRRQAHAVRAEVIEHLEEYLGQFIHNAQKNGVTVHRAENAAAAVKIVLGIVKDSPLRTHSGAEKSTAPLGALRDKKILVAKSKSMVSEEINLNHALEAEGIRVVETDLGEYIVQLRNERPSHIITPAVHLRRQEVGQLFHEKLDIPYTEDIPTLTNTARKLLREVFLTAQVGISGVNFGVAETGSICIVSNEGNARMVTTLPPIHIALMGMERLVRSLDDLALMLSLLPRSATGQKLSVYTQLIQSPLSHQQRHLILLDNGRSGLRNSPLKESLYCIRCGACLNACPVFRELGGHAYNSVYPGPIGSVISAGFFGPDFVPLAQTSSLCGACKEACPVDIDLPKLLTRVRAGQFPIIDSRLPRNGGLSPLSSLFLRIYSRIARSPRLFAVSQRFASLAARLASPFDPWIRLPASTGWGYSKDFPRFAKTPFRLRFERLDVMSPGIQVGNPTFKPTRIGKSMQMYQDVDALISQYVEELTKVGGYITRIHPKKLTAEVIDLLKTRGLDRLHLEPNILDESALVQSGIEISSVVDPEIRVGLTKAVCGLADTGSILVVDGEGDPLQASLLPEIHIAVLDTSRILPSLADALTLPAVRESSSTVVITGPSRTSDIEMSHTIGVHGSGQVHVFLVDD